MSPFEFFTIQQIDAIKGIRTPHDSDLKDIGKKHIEVFRNLHQDDLVSLSKELDVLIEDLDYGESWAFTKEFFPEVKIHVLMQVDDEGLSPEPFELQFLFSGTRVTWISGEDLCHLVEILLNYAATCITEQFPQDTYTGSPSPLLSKAMIERTIDWQNVPMNKEIHSYFVFIPFPGLNIEYDIATNPSEFKISSENLQKFWIYDIDRLVIMGFNQTLRLVKVRLNELGEDIPPICNMMFSGYYKKSHPDQFP